jgi:predicted negative regulator of RcsB-dependent stress response
MVRFFEIIKSVQDRTKNGWIIPATACAFIIGIYACTVPLGKLEASISNPADSYYNLLVQGFRAGQLNLKTDVPPGLIELSDPYDPRANDLYQNIKYRLRDLSYYNGKLYAYFGVTPALILYWPFVALTGKYATGRYVVMLFCGVGMLASVGLLRAVWRRYFPDVSAGVVVACALALTLTTGVVTMLPRSEVHEVATSCGYMFTMLALVAIWCALHEPERRCGWLVAASLAYGLAVGSRPNLVFGAVILVVPVIKAWRERRSALLLLMAAVGPIVIIGLGLMLYNWLRFDNPFEFGWRYQLAGKRQVSLQSLSGRYLWFNLWVYFVQPVHWSARFPFLYQVSLNPPAVDYYWGPESFGLLTNVPLVWLALALPLALRSDTELSRSTLRWFIASVALLFAICALMIGLFCWACIRYAVDFVPALVLLAVFGILGLERVLAGRPVWRRTARCIWGVMLGVSVAFNLLTTIMNYGNIECGFAAVLTSKGRLHEAIETFEKGLRLSPENADAHAGLGYTLLKDGKIEGAIGLYEQALRIKPDYTGVHNDLGAVLAAQGKFVNAIEHFEKALQLKPDYAEAHCNLGYALEMTGRREEAAEQYREALKLSPNLSRAKTGLERLGVQN